jgi:hypothetical protein
MVCNMAASSPSGRVPLLAALLARFASCPIPQGPTPTSPLERLANDGTADDQSPAHDEAKGRGHGVECQLSCQSRQAQREQEAERAGRGSFEPRADPGQRRADPIIR